MGGDNVKIELTQIGGTSFESVFIFRSSQMIEPKLRLQPSHSSEKRHLALF